MSAESVNDTCPYLRIEALSVEVRTHNAGIMRIAMDPSNRVRVTGCEDKTVRLWHISGRGEPPSGERAGHGPAPLEGGGGNH